MKLTAQAALALALPAAVQASRCRPNPPDDCGAGEPVNHALHDDPSASSFCSSYLHIPTVTQTESTTVTQATSVTDAIISTVMLPPVTVSKTVTTTTTMCSIVPIRRDAQHTPQPTSNPDLPDCLQPFPESKISKACSCLNLPTPTVTSTATETLAATVLGTEVITVTLPGSTVTETATKTMTTAGCPLPTTCNNQGLHWQYLLNHSGPDDDDYYSNFMPDDYKGLPFIEAGITPRIGFDSTAGPDINVYGSDIPVGSSSYVFNHFGYIYAHKNGLYTFDFSAIDDAVYFWVGGNAVSDWSIFNAAAGLTFGESRAFQTVFLQGQYYPVRFLYAQDTGSAVFTVTVTAPDGTLVLGDDTNPSAYVVRYSCDETSAPDFS